MKGFALDFGYVVSVAESSPARSDSAKIGVCNCSGSRGVLRLVSRDEMVGHETEAGEAVRDEIKIAGEGGLVRCVPT